jgi:hypothetical protein
VSASVAVGDSAAASLAVTNTGVADLFVTPRGKENPLGVRPMADDLDVIFVFAGGGFEAFVDSVRAQPNVKSLVAIDGSFATPTLAQLQAAQAVIVASNTSWSNPAGLGDVLADYVDGLLPAHQAELLALRADDAHGRDPDLSIDPQLWNGD